MKIAANLDGQRFSWVENEHAPEADEKLWDAGFSEAVVRAIKAEAQRRIVALTGGGEYWREKQSNMTALGTRLARKESRGTITPEELTALNGLEAFFDKVNAIRAHSNTLEAAFIGGANINLATGWPE